MKHFHLATYEPAGLEDDYPAEAAKSFKATGAWKPKKSTR